MGLTTIELLRRYKLRAFPILADMALRRAVKVPVRGRTFYQHADKSTLYHIVRSYPKMERMVYALPPVLSGAVVDCGANNGLFSFHMTSRYPSLPVYAIEPLVELGGILRRNLPTAHLIAQAIGSAKGVADFYACPWSDQIGSINRNNAEAFGPALRRVVQMTTLDDVVDFYDIGRIAVLKMDVQGAELAALQGGAKALEITDFLIIEAFLYDENTVEALRLAADRFPFHRAINPIPYGADILFSKTDLWN